MAKIVFLTYDLPYPLTSGGKIRAFHLIKALWEHGHQVALISYSRRGDDLSDSDKLKEYCSSIHVFPRRWVWHPYNFLKAVFSWLPFPAVSYLQPSLKRFLVKELKDSSYDAVFFESFYPTVYLPAAKKYKVKTILGNENLEYLVYQRFRQSGKLFFLWPFLFLDNWKMKRIERRWWKMADLNLAVSPEDAKEISRVTWKSCELVPNGIDYEFYSRANLKKSGDPVLVFSGNLSYLANREAVLYFLEKIWPKIVGKVKKVHLEIVSKTKPAWIERYLKDGRVKLIQDTKNPVRDHLARGDIFVAPMTVGSGTNIKVLEAMAVGLPVVASPKGVEGLPVIPGETLFVEPYSEGFANAVLTLLSDVQLRSHLGRCGQVFVENNFNVAHINNQFVSNLGTFLNSSNSI